jgi:hypothetical protein
MAEEDKTKSSMMNQLLKKIPTTETGAKLAALKTRKAAASLLNKRGLVSDATLGTYGTAVEKQQQRLNRSISEEKTYAAPYLKEGFIGKVGPWMQYCIFGLVLWYVLVWMVFYPPQTDQQKSMAFMIGLIAFAAALNTFLKFKNYPWINFYLFCGLLVLYTILKYMNIRYNQIKVGEGVNKKKPNYWKLNFGMMFAFLVGIVLSYFLIKPENSMTLKTLGWFIVVVLVVVKIVVIAYTFKNTDKNSVYSDNLNSKKQTTVVLNITEKDFYDAYLYLFLAILGVFIYSFCLLALSFLTHQESPKGPSSDSNPGGLLGKLPSVNPASTQEMLL